jgi:hypothetical protein
VQRILSVLQTVPHNLAHVWLVFAALQHEVSRPLEHRTFLLTLRSSNISAVSYALADHISFTRGNARVSMTILVCRSVLGAFPENSAKDYKRINRRP